MDNEGGPKTKTPRESAPEEVESILLESSSAIRFPGNSTTILTVSPTEYTRISSLAPLGYSDFDPYADSLQFTPGSESEIRSQSSPIKLQSHDILKEPLLDDHAIPGTVYLGTFRRYHLGILLPALITSLVSAGTASALLGWLISRRVKSADSGLFHHALVAIESPPTIFDQIFRPVHTGNDGVATTMYGLALSSLVVHVIPFTIPFVLGIFAYLLAHMWLKGQKRGHIDSLPTPTQYGHLIGLCGSSGIRNVYDTAKYLGRRNRPAASMTLVLAFSATAFVLFFGYFLSVADLWLHTTTTTISYNFQTPISSDLLPAMGSRINTTLCPGAVPYILNGSVTGYTNCQHSQASDWNVLWGSAALINEGAAVLDNSSFTSQIQIIDNLATLLPKDLPSGVQNLVFRTFAMEATCGPVSTCAQGAYLPGTDDIYLILCEEFSPPFAVSGEAPFEPMLNQFNSTDNALMFQSWTRGTPASGVGPAGHTSGGGYALDATLNPTGVLAVLYWAGGGELSMPAGADNLAGWYNHTDTSTLVTYSFYFNSCVLDVWDVTLSYSASANDSAPSFTIVSDSKSRCDFNTTSALLAALDAAYSATLASQLTTTLQRSSSVSSAEFSHFLAGNLSQGVLAYAAPLTERMNSTSGDQFTLVTASRYPLAPLCLILTLAYGYALIALGVGVTAFTLSSREVICEAQAGEGGSAPPERIQELELLHLRLTSPRACIADRFHASEMATQGQPILKGDVIFREARSARRLGAGYLLGDGSVRCSDGGSGITLRNVRRFTVDIVGESGEEQVS